MAITAKRELPVPNAATNGWWAIRPAKTQWREDMWLVLLVALMLVLPISAGIAALRNPSAHGQEPYPGL
jgi:hypothetical protein